MNGKKNLAVPSLGNSLTNSSGLQMRESFVNAPAKKHMHVWKSFIRYPWEKGSNLKSLGIIRHGCLALSRGFLWHQEGQYSAWMHSEDNSCQNLCFACCYVKRWYDTSHWMTWFSSIASKDCSLISCYRWQNNLLVTWFSSDMNILQRNLVRLRGMELNERKWDG